MAGPSIRLIELDNVLYLPSVLETGQSLCLVEQRAVPLETVLDCWTIDFFHKLRLDNPAYRRAYVDDFEVRTVSARACILGNVFSRNFGHWTEELLKVAILEHTAQDCCYVISGQPPFALESLLLLGIDERRIISVETPTIFARAVFTTAISHQNIAAYPTALFRLRELVESRLTNRTSRYGKRLWLERGAMLRSGGTITNRDEVYRTLAPYDFDVIDMATLSVAEQIVTVRGATTIAGPHGSQFVHAQFMPPASTVIECFSPIYVNPSILQICRVLGHSYHQVVARSQLIAPYQHGRDCVVECEHLSLVVDSFEI
jgi:capsular polysaccharide biosynthesis protein